MPHHQDSPAQYRKQWLRPNDRRRPNMTDSELVALMERISNWGRWGKEDQRGTLNLLTIEKRQRAIKLASTGESVSMSLPLATAAAPDNPTPAFHLMISTGYDLPPQGLQASSDYLAIPTHGRAITHLDALCHMFWRGKMYNGYSPTEVGAHGTNKCGIDTSFDGIIGRGILLDIPKLKNVDWLEKGEKIFPADLEAAEKKQGVRVEEGDILSVRTGRHKFIRAKGSWNPWVEGQAGLEAACLPWLRERGVAVLVGDAVSDVTPSGYTEVSVPIHAGAIVMMGLPLIDNADLEALSEFCARSRRYEFMFITAPLVIPRATASPINPLALF
jgi:kynurenine formamidase